MKCTLITFHRLCGTHNGESLAETTYHLLKHANIIKKVCALFSDQVLLRYNIIITGGPLDIGQHIKQWNFYGGTGVLLRADSVAFNHLNHKIMCFLHVINICCQHVIREFINLQLAETAKDFVALPAALPHHQSYKDAVKHDPVALGCNIVHIM